MSVSMREMLEAGCHFGHQTRFWNPKMAQYIFGARNKIHIINLEKTVEKLAEAEKFVRELSARGGKILFVDTKRGGRDTIIEQAQRAGCCYVDQRWLGGTLTNFKTVKQTIRHLKDMEATPDALFVIDVGYHKIAIQEANKLGIPVVAVVDTNHSPEGVDYVIPGNDDSGKAVPIYASVIADAILAGRADVATGEEEAQEEFVEVEEKTEA